MSRKPLSRQLEKDFQSAADPIWKGGSEGDLSGFHSGSELALYNFSCLRLTPDLQYRTFEIQGMSIFTRMFTVTKVSKTLLKCESAYASLISEDSGSL